MFFVLVALSRGGAPAAILWFGAFWPVDGLMFLKDVLVSWAGP